MNKPSLVLIALALFSYCLIAWADETFQIRFFGLEGDAQKNVQTLLTLASNRIKTKQDLLKFYAKSHDEIKTALEPFGFFKPTITSTIAHTNNQWLINFYIDPGPAVIVTKVDFALTGEGADADYFRDIVAHFPIAAGQVFSTLNYNKAKSELQDMALQKGYFDAQMTTQQIKINVPDNSAEITLHFNTGIRYRYGTVRFNETPYSPEFVIRFADFAPGEYYDAKQVQQFQENLGLSNDFRQADVEPKVDLARNGFVPIDVALQAMPKRQFDLGIGYGTDTGPRGMINYLQRQITPSGQRFRAQLQASAINSILQADYTIPGTHPATDKYVITAAAQHQRINPGKSTVEKGGFSYVSAVAGLQQTLALFLHQEQWNLNGQMGQSELLLLPRATWSKTFKDNPTNPTKGFRFGLGVFGTPKIFSDNTPFIQSTLNLKGLYPLFSTDEIVGRLDLGHTAINNVKNLPLSLQLLAGGAESLRAYSYNSIGPGSSLFVSSLEYRHRIKGNWFAAGFFDSGNVSNSFPGRLKKSAGLGGLWKSPVGNLEATIGHAFDMPGKNISLQFNMGPDL
jgi:translocation and assembly module TamA